MKSIVLTYFLFRAILIILVKYNMLEKFKRYASACSFRFIFNLSKCDFCMHHHIAIIPTLIVGALIDFEPYLLIMPLVVASIQNFTNERNNS